jgi:hypothetical protein
MAAHPSATHSGVATVLQSSLNEAMVSVRHAWRTARMADSAAVTVATFCVRKALSSSASAPAMYAGTSTSSCAIGRGRNSARVSVSSTGLYLRGVVS